MMQALVHATTRIGVALSHSPPVDRGPRNAYFAERGLVSLAAEWRELQGRAIIAPVQLALPLGYPRVETPAPDDEGDLGRRRPEEPDVRPTSPVP
ncbi:hypothetical protein [Sorangium sp. So ce1097]|uniref:hypothetical protein n=1 Tax=Sorangium sp. So ce1097 TaxID=3133330 RepID=UPI003F634798